MTTGQKIAELRKNKRITQEQLSVLLNVSRQSVSRWELDAAFPETEKLIKLSKILECSIDFLLTENATLSNDNYTFTSVYDCYKFIKESGNFFLATSVDNQPSLRPMGMIYTDNKYLYFATDKRKQVYIELSKNTKVAIASYNINSNKWIRILGYVEIENTISIKEEFINMYPTILQEFAYENEIYFVVYKMIIEKITV